MPSSWKHWRFTTKAAATRRLISHCKSAPHFVSGPCRAIYACVAGMIDARSASSPPDRTDSREDEGPSQRRAIGFFGAGHDPSKPHRPYSPHLASGARRQAALSHRLGCGDGARARPHHRHGVAAARIATSSAPTAAPMRSTGRWPSPPARSIRFAAPTSPTRSPPSPSARSSNGPARAPSSRSTRGGTWWRRPSSPRSPRASTSGPASPSRAPGSTSRRCSSAVAAGRLASDGVVVQRERQPIGGQGRHRSGLVSARHRRALRRHARRACAARCSSRPPACSPSSSRGPTCRCSCRRSAAPRSTCSAMSTKLADPATRITCRVHDECNGSDVFGSDICTCRPYLVHGIEECARAAQAGGLGVIVYNRKEGRALGEVTKFLVYNARKRQEGGDAATRLLRAHGMRGRRAGCALPAADAGRDPLAGARAHRPLRLHERHEVRRAREPGHRDRRARAASPTSWCPPTRRWRSWPRRRRATTAPPGSPRPQDPTGTVGRALDKN